MTVIPRGVEGIGTLPRVGALERIRSNPKLAVATAGGVVLVLAWIGWAVYVTSDHGSRAGLGALIAVPALIIAAAIVALPFIGGYLLIRGLSGSEDDAAVTAPAEEETEDAAEEDDAEEPDEKDGNEEGGSGDEAEADSEAEASTKG